MTAAAAPRAATITAAGLTKVYRKHVQRNQFKTLKSALLTGSVLADLKPEETFTALEDVSFEVRQGSTFAVIGENGSGKSTLIKTLAGYHTPDPGSRAELDGATFAL